MVRETIAPRSARDSDFLYEARKLQNHKEFSPSRKQNTCRHSEVPKTISCDSLCSRAKCLMVITAGAIDFSGDTTDERKYFDRPSD